jgi:predicted RNA-binding Zn ribbon-like protein
MNDHVSTTKKAAPGREGRPIGRFGVAAAPGGLRFIQDLVNTALAEQPAPKPDLLATPDAASTWLREALDEWAEATGMPAPVIDLGPFDLGPLRDHRELLRAVLRAAPVDAPAPGGDSLLPVSSRDITAKALITVTADGQARYEPLESGWRAIRALTSLETLLAQATGTWPRLKTCAYATCGVCFYDSSPNRSRVWHDTRKCGNVTNLRASRARKHTN